MCNDVDDFSSPSDGERYTNDKRGFSGMCKVDKVSTYDCSGLIISPTKIILYFIVIFSGFCYGFLYCNLIFG